MLILVSIVILVDGILPTVFAKKAMLMIQIKHVLNVQRNALPVLFRTQIAFYAQS